MWLQRSKKHSIYATGCFCVYPWFGFGRDPPIKSAYLSATTLYVGSSAMAAQVLQLVHCGVALPVKIYPILFVFLYIIAAYHVGNR